MLSDLADSPGVLVWPHGVNVERFSGFVGPVGGAEEFAADEDQIGAVAGDDGFGLVGVGDAANGSGGNVCSVFDGFGEVDLVAGTDGDVGIGGGAATADVNEIEAERHEGFGEFNTVFDCPSAFDPIGARDAHHQGFFFRENGAAGGNDFPVESGAVFK